MKQLPYISVFVFLGGIIGALAMISSPQSVQGAYQGTSVPVVYTTTTPAIGGSLLAALGSCTAVTTSSLPGVTTVMPVVATPVTPDSNWGSLWQVDAFVSAANVVSTKLCAIAAVTPAATAINIRVIQ